MGREGALVRGVSRREKDQEIGVSLATPDMIRLLQEAQGIKPKPAPAYRFYLLDDKVLGQTSGLMPTRSRNNTMEPQAWAERRSRPSRQLGVSDRSLISITAYS